MTTGRWHPFLLPFALALVVVALFLIISRPEYVSGFKEWIRPMYPVQQYPQIVEPEYPDVWMPYSPWVFGARNRCDEGHMYPHSYDVPPAKTCDELRETSNEH